MKRSIVGVAILGALLLTGCTNKGSEQAEPSEKKKSNSTEISDDGQKVAERLRDLLVTKCGDRYYFADAMRMSRTVDSNDDPINPPVTMGYAHKDVKTEYQPHHLDIRDRFYGTEARGRVSIAGDPNSWPMTLELVKKNGGWYLRTGKEDGDVRVDSLQAVKPECPQQKN